MSTANSVSIIISICVISIKTPSGIPVVVHSPDCTMLPYHLFHLLWLLFYIYLISILQMCAVIPICIFTIYWSICIILENRIRHIWFVHQTYPLAIATQCILKITTSVLIYGRSKLIIILCLVPFCSTQGICNKIVCKVRQLCLTEINSILVCQTIINHIKLSKSCWWKCPARTIWILITICWIVCPYISYPILRICCRYWHIQALIWLI